MTALSLSSAARPSKSRSAGANRRTARAKPAGPSRESLVADYLAICTLDLAVETFARPAGPATFEFSGRRIDHVADFEVTRDGVAQLVDVVTDADLARHPLRAAFVGEAASAADGRRFAFETASSIRAEPRYSTLRLVLACRHTPVSAGDRVRVLHHLDECGSASLVECAGTVLNTQDGVAAVLALAVEGLVAVGIDGPILPETPVRRRRLALPD